MRFSIFFSILFSTFLYAQTLSELLLEMKQNNELLQGARLEISSKQKEQESLKKSYLPTLEVGAFYRREDDPTPFQPGTVYSARGQITWHLYQGNKRRWLISAATQEKNAKRHTYYATYNDLALAVTQDFFRVLSLQAALKAQIDAKDAIKAQRDRIRAFYDANITTSDAVDRLQAALDKSTYAIESLRFEIYALKKSIELRTHTRIDSLQPSAFTKTSVASAPLEDIVALKNTQNAILYNAKAIQSALMPQITLQDSYSFYGYEDEPSIALPQLPPIGIDFLKNQNRFEVVLVWRLFDFGSITRQKEAVKLQARALEQKILFQTRQQTMQQELARKRIQTAYLRLKSAKSALKAAKSALTTITQKYKNGIVDNVTYLDALQTHTQAKSAFEKAKNDIEIAYALYYYYNNKNLQEYLK